MTKQELTDFANYLDFVLRRKKIKNAIDKTPLSLEFEINDRFWEITKFYDKKNKSFMNEGVCIYIHGIAHFPYIFKYERLNGYFIDFECDDKYFELFLKDFKAFLEQEENQG